MDHETYVWLVNPHTKGNGSTDDLQEIILQNAIQYITDYSIPQYIYSIPQEAVYHSMSTVYHKRQYTTVYHSILQYITGGSIHVPQYIRSRQYTTVYPQYIIVNYSIHLSPQMVGYLQTLNYNSGVYMPLAPNLAIYPHRLKLPELAVFKTRAHQRVNAQCYKLDCQAV